MREITLFSLLLVAAQYCYAGNYADCSLDKMPGSETDAVIGAVLRTCSNENPGLMYSIKKGDGLGIFSFDDSNSCVLKKARKTNNQRAASLITYSCRCLYDEPTFKDEMCAYRPVSNFQPAAPPPPAQPAPLAVTPIQIAPTTPQVSNQQPKKPTKEELKEIEKGKAYDRQEKEARAYSHAQVNKDFQEIIDRSIRDYPFLNTQEGAHVASQILSKKDAYVRQGDYPSVALQRAINDYAPAYANERQAKRKPQPTIEMQTPSEPVADANGCRWVSAIEWKCKKD